jgi:ribose transport system permease protein
MRLNRSSVMGIVLSSMPWLFLAVVTTTFARLSNRFLTIGNLTAILAQSSWLIVAALGVNFVLLCSAVDLSIGSIMYLSAVVVGTTLGNAPVWVCLLAATTVGALTGAANGLLVVRFKLPSFIVTLACAFIARSLGLYLSSTRIVFMSDSIAELGRLKLWGLPESSMLAIAALGCAGLLLRRTPFGLYVRSIGADADGARKVGVPTGQVVWLVFVVCGCFAGFAGFILVSQASAASAGFGQKAEFLAIAAAVLGGTSLFGGRGTLLAPVIGSILITTVQNGLAVTNANPYAYPVIVGLVIFLAALLDSLRSRLAARSARSQRRQPTKEAADPGARRYVAS